MVVQCKPQQLLPRRTWKLTNRVEFLLRQACYLTLKSKSLTHRRLATGPDQLSIFQVPFRAYDACMQVKDRRQAELAKYSCTF